MGNKRGTREGGRDETCNLEFVSSLQDSRFRDSDPGVPLRSTPGYSNYAPSAQLIMSEIHFYRGGTRVTQEGFPLRTPPFQYEFGGTSCGWRPNYNVAVNLF